MMDNGLLTKVENLLTWTTRRQEALSANVANQDTPGYIAKDYSFDSELQTLSLASTSGQHIAPSENEANIRMYDVDSTVKPNGNSVDLDRELTEINKNGLQYLTLIEYLNQKLRTLRSSITDGGKV